MPRFTRGRKLLLAGLVGGVPILAIGVEATSVPSLCRGCHEIAPAHESWSRSQHAPKDGKTRAECRDCHIPSWTNPLAVLWVKLERGVGDGYRHLADGDAARPREFYFRLKQRALMDVPDETCLGCHDKVLRPAEDVIRTDEGIVRGLHSSAEIKGLRCTMCHKNTGHDLYH